MLGPLLRWATGCMYPLLPLSHRPSPKSHGSASHNAPFNDFRTEGCFRGCSHSFIFRPPSLLATQVVPTAGYRLRCPGQPWRLHLSRTCVVTFTCIRYASRLNRVIDGEGLSPPRFAALPAAPGLSPFPPRRSPGATIQSLRPRAGMPYHKNSTLDPLIPQEARLRGF